MAKQPDPKKTSKPEKLPPPLPIDPEEQAFADLANEEPQPLSSDSTIDLGQEVPVASAVDSDSFDWNNLADEPPPSSHPSTPAKFDAPSDVDVLANAPSSLIPGKTTIPAEDDALATMPAMDLGVESSRVDLSEPPPSYNPLGSSVEKGRVPHYDDEDVIDLDATKPPVGHAPATPDLDLGLDEPVFADDEVELLDDEVIDLSSEVVIAADSGVLVEEEVIDMEASGPTLLLPDGAAGLAQAQEEVIDLSPPSGQTGESSVIDLSNSEIEIVDASASAIGSGALARVQGEESGINLDNFDAVEDADEQVVMDELLVVEGSSSSAVDLGETVAPTDGASGLVLESASDAAMEVLEEDPEPPTLAPGEASDEEMFDLINQPTGPMDISSDEDVSIEDEGGPPSRGTGEVELGGPRPILDDSNEGTLEDRQVPVEDDFMAAAEEEAAEEPPPPPKKAKGKPKPVAVEDDEDEAPVKAAPSKPAKRSVLPLVATGLGSILVGAAACFGGLFLANMVTLDDKPKTTQPGPQGKKDPPKGSVAREISIARLVDAGDFSEDPPAIEDNDPKQLASRGQYRWLKYLQTHLNDKEKKPAAADQEVQDALTDLQKAVEGGDLEALYWIGHVHEMTGNVNEARKVYGDGKGKNDPKFTPLFDAGLNRLDVLRTGNPNAQTRVPVDPAELLLILLLLQMEDPMKEEPEAGFDFWKAIKLARDQKYSEANTALATAKANHDKRRMTRLRKAQNPTSDPTDEIFLRCCDELTRLWAIQDKLRTVPNLALDKNDPVKGLDAVVLALTTARADIVKLTGEKTTLETANTKLATDLKNATDKVATLTTDLKNATDKITTTEMDRDKKIKDKDTEIVNAKKEIKDANDKVVLANNQIAQLTKDKDALADTQTKIVGKLEKAMMVNPKPDTKQIMDGLDKVIKLAEMKDPSSELRNATLKNEMLAKELEQRWTPTQMLSVWQPLLTDRKQVTLAPKALLDIERARKDDPKAKAQALYVEALVLRAQNKNDEAKAKLDAAIKESNKKEPWSAQAETLLKEWTDPNVYYFPEINKLYRQRDYSNALVKLDEALGLFPASKGKLLALRANVRLDMLLDQKAGELDPNGAEVKQIDLDNSAAEMAGDAAVEAALAAGRRLEATKQYDKAVEQYKKAETNAKGRQLLEAWAGQARSLHNGSTDTAVMQALDLARKVLNAPDIDKEPLLKAQMLLLQEKWTPALKAHATGLQPYLSYQQGATLLDLIRDNPSLGQQNMGGAQAVDLFAAEKNYGIGLDLYFAHKYAEAEKAFTRSIEADNQDARYYYYLGLARLAQSNTGGALKAFNAGAKLEIQNKPNSGSIANALERVQGTSRQMINAARDRARE